jgi:hypothetical protein
MSWIMKIVEYKNLMLISSNSWWIIRFLKWSLKSIKQSDKLANSSCKTLFCFSSLSFFDCHMFILSLYSSFFLFECCFSFLFAYNYNL